jgi:TusA-related sulfurtransferase
VSNIEKSSETLQTDFFLDITGEVCPLTFVRTKLLIERMAAGQTALIRLKGAEPLANVPRSIEAAGHVIEACLPEDPEAPAAAVHRLVIRKR